MAEASAVKPETYSYILTFLTPGGEIYFGHPKNIIWCPPLEKILIFVIFV